MERYHDHMKFVLGVLLMSLLGWGCDESRVLRSAGDPCTSADECESNLCYESVCLAGPGQTPGDPPPETSPAETDCPGLCGHMAACQLLEEGDTEEGCTDFCEENPQLMSPLLSSCAETHLGDGQCDEDAFGECSDGPVIDFFERASTAFCTRIVACCEGQDAGLFSSVDDCVGLVVGIGGGFINASALMGYLAFDEGVAEACATKLEEVLPGTSCDVLPADIGTYFADMAACAGLMTPLQGEGDPCGITLGEDYTALPDGCLDGLVCEGPGDVMPTCEQGIAPGGDCSAEGAQCGGDAECVDGVCTEQRAEGDACTAGQQCASDNCEQGACGPPSPLCPPPAGE